MAVLYAKAAGGNYSAAGTWSNVNSAGVDNSGPPTASTDVIFELGSGNVNIDVSSACRSLDTTSGTGSYGGVLTHTSTRTLSIGDATAGAGNVAFKLNSGMTYTLSGASTALNFVSSSATQQTITMGGKTCGNITFNGSGANWALQDKLTYSGNFTRTTGTFTHNNQDVESTGSGNAIVTGTNTFYNLIRTGTAAKTDLISFTADITVSNIFTVTGNSSINRVLIQSNTTGTAKTITAAAWVITNADFQDITGAGAGSRDFSELTDNFNDNSIDTAKWTSDGGGQIVETGSSMQMTTAMGGNYVTLSSVNAFNLTGSYVASQLVNAGDQALTSLEAYPIHLAVSSDTTNAVSIMITGNTIYARKKLASVSSTVGSTIPYDSAVHKYFRIRESGGTTYWDYSTDNSSWSNIASATNPITVTSILEQIITGTWQAEASTTTVIYDNFTSTAYRIIGDCGGNTSITFPASVQQTSTGTSSFSWSTHGWTTRVPLPQDDVVINNAFSASQTVTADMPRLGRSINWTGATGTPAWSFGSTTNTIYGSITLISGMTISGSNTTTLAGRSAYNITSAGKTWTQAFTISAPTGTYTLQDAYTASPATAFTLSIGGFVDGGNTVTVNNFNSNNSTTRTLTMTGTWNISSTSATTVWQMGSSGLTFNATSSTIRLSNATSNSRTFIFAALSYGTFSYNIAGSTGAMIFQESAAPTFVNFNFSDASNARSLTLPSFFTTTFTGNFNVQGTSGKLMTIIGSTNGQAAIISKAANTVSCDYLSIKDSNATGGATWYAGANSTSVSGNSGWIFTAAPATSVASAASIQSVRNLMNLQRL